MDTLAAIERESASPGEAEAARLIAEALGKRGTSGEVELERVHGSYWWPLGVTSAAGILAGLAGRRGRRLLGAVLGLGAAYLAADDLSVGHRLVRKALWKHTTANVVAEAGDREASRTVMLVAHHDAAHTGFFFNPRLTKLVGRLLELEPGKPIRQPPLMAPIVAAPALAGLGALLGLRKVASLSALACLGIIGSFADMGLRGTVAGANDNLTGVMTLLGVAEALQEEPLEGLRVLLVSTGGEEALMAGMAAFSARHPELFDPATTKVICVDTVGSPHLVLPEGEGMIRMRHYDESMKDLLAAVAAARGIDLGRGMKVRLGTDGYVALREKVPAAMIMSLDEGGSSSNYHWPTDVPDQVRYDKVAEAIALCEAAVRALAADEAAWS